jgi:transcriptional regulator with XRE-family HTH domain
MTRGTRVEPDLPIGERIALYRRRRGLSQPVFAGLLGKSESWVSKVERGVLPVDRLSTLVEVARVLRVEVSALTGQPALLEPPDGNGHEGVPALRRALTDYGPVPGMTFPDEAEPEDVAALAREVTGLRRAWQATRYWDVSTRLSGLLARARATEQAALADDRPRAARLLAEAHQVAADLLMKVGEVDLAYLAVDRALRLADRGDDPAQTAAAAWHLSFVLYGFGRLAEAQQVSEAAAGELEPALTARATPAWSLWGALLLKAAIAAARQDDGRAAWHLLGDAQRAASRTGDRNDYWTVFGPTNTAIHATGIAVELGQPVEALRHARQVTAAPIASAERRAHHLIDVARAHGQQRRDAEAVRALLGAERLAPEEVRYAVFARQLVRDLLARERRDATPGLRGLADRLRIAA